MDIHNYIDFFHDGGVINIEYINTNIIISMDSAEISPEDIVDDVALTDYKAIKGKLHIEGVVSISEDGKLLSNGMKMLSDSAEILNFELDNNIVYLGLEWVNFPPKVDDGECSFFKIEAKKIWWENIPDLYDPFRK